MSARAIAVVIATWALASSTAWAAGPTSGSHPNVWVLDSSGTPVATYQLTSPGYSLDTRAAGPGVEVLVDGVWTMVPGATGVGHAVFANRLDRSWPLTIGGMPAVSIVGLAPATHNAATPNRPGISISPPSGPLIQTTRVSVIALPALTNPNPVSLAVWANGTSMPVVGTQFEMWLAEAGTTNLTAVATQLTGTGAPITHTSTATFTLSPADPFDRDSDGDGIPDIVEVDWGFDPLTAGETHFDSDGDGVPDLAERLRGSDPWDADSAPLDTDGDGWFDWDENLRGTDSNDASSHPACANLLGVEVLLEASVWLDAITLAGAGEFALYSLGGELEGALIAAASLGAVGPTRVCGRAPLVARAQLDAIEPLGNEWVAKAFVPSSPDLTWPEIHSAVSASGAPWSTAEAWLALVETELQTMLVTEEHIELSPQSTALVVAIEAAADWRSGAAVGPPCQFGGNQPQACGTAAAESAKLESLALPLSSAMSPGGTLASLPVQVTTTMATAGSIGTSSANALAHWLQRDTSSSALRYGCHLIAALDPSTLSALSPPTRAHAFVPTNDTDSDGAVNAAELSGGPEVATNPLNPDTDGDGFGDNSDPCPLDPQQKCLIEQSLLADSDGDGVLDATDNCLEVPNAQQLDTNADGIGNACEAPARIAQPVGHRTLIAGGSLALSRKISAAAALPVSVEWRIDGVAVSTLPQPAPFTFATPGTKVVELRASDAVTPMGPVDHRIIQVLAQ